MEQQCKEDRVLLAKVSCEKVWSKVSSYEVQNSLHFKLVIESEGTMVLLGFVAWEN
jgi:hypothetical protein